MTQALPFRKIFDGVATREQMFELFNRVPDCPFEDRISGKAFENTWFEIELESYESMLGELPPLFMRAGMFAWSELKAGFVGSVFFAITIGRKRWFTGYCNLGDRHSPDAMRARVAGSSNGKDRKKSGWRKPGLRRRTSRAQAVARAASPATAQHAAAITAISTCAPGARAARSLQAAASAASPRTRCDRARVASMA